TMFEGSKVRSGLSGAPEHRDGAARALVRAWWRLGVRCLRARGRLRSHVSRGIDACGPDLARPALRALRACVARAWPRPFGSHLAGRMVGPFGSRLAGRFVAPGDPDARVARVGPCRCDRERGGPVARDVDEGVGRLDPDRADVTAFDVA